MIIATAMFYMGRNETAR